MTPLEPSPEFSVVTISYNQAPFLRAAIESVLDQRRSGASVQYIVCDPGSADGSRDIIDSYGADIDVRVFERDDGPADGLNRGFARACGKIYCYINSDDYFLPHAFAQASCFFADHPDVDVIIGHALVVDAQGRTLRRVWSEPYSRFTVAHGAHVQIQPSTFIRAAAFREARGFDITDRSNWDGSLLDRLYLAGARFAVVDAFFSAYRLHAGSITLSGRMVERHRESQSRRFNALMGREQRRSDHVIAALLRIGKHLRWPNRTLERLRYGPLFRRTK